MCITRTPCIQYAAIYWYCRPPNSEKHLFHHNTMCFSTLSTGFSTRFSVYISYLYTFTVFRYSPWFSVKLPYSCRLLSSNTTESPRRGFELKCIFSAYLYPAGRLFHGFPQKFFTTNRLKPGKLKSSPVDSIYPVFHDAVHPYSEHKKTAERPSVPLLNFTYFFGRITSLPPM